MHVNHESRVLALEISTVLKLCEGIGSVRALTVSLLIQYEQWDELLALSVDPNHYNSHQLFADDYLVTSCLQKNPRLPTGIDKKKVAIGKFYASEENCKETNNRLDSYQRGEFLPSMDIHRVVHYAREYIRDVLGPLTQSDLRRVYESCRFGPGATTSLSGVVTQGKKYSPRTIEATPRVVNFRAFGFPALWKRYSPAIRQVRSSKLTTVPKSAKTDRVICIEPDLNIFIQLGFGTVLREKLSESGLDLRTQSWNQWLASQASNLGLCTMDLSAASDSISRELVWLLLPYRWAAALEIPRVDFTTIDGVEIPLQKWSSMGNGYTFELESLIFSSIIHAAHKELGLSDLYLGTYGDDLIFDSSAQDLVSRALNFLGFSVNCEKTFGEGRFRESCGTDWYDGVNVRPLFFRSELHDFESICYLYANNLRRYACRHSGGRWCDVRLLPAWLRCFSASNPKFRFRIPDGFGDGGFVSSFEEATPSPSSRDRGWAGFRFRYRKLNVLERSVSTTGALLATLAGSLNNSSGGVEALRGRFLPSTTNYGYVLTWPYLGPWM